MKECGKCGVIKDSNNASTIITRHGKEVFHTYCRKCIATRVRQYNRDNPIKYMFLAARQRAKKQNVPFTITEEDIVIPEVCPIFGIPLVMAEGRPNDNSPSLDKIIPSKGYVPDNIIVISHRANSIKRDSTPEELRLLADFYEP